MIQTNKVISRRLEMLTKRYLLSVGWTKSLITTKKMTEIKNMIPSVTG